MYVPSWLVQGSFKLMIKMFLFDKEVTPLSEWGKDTQLFDPKIYYSGRYTIWRLII